MLLVVMVVLDRRNRDDHVPETHRQVQREQQEVAIVLKTDTVVHPWAMVVHEEDTCAANGAVVRPCGLDFITVLALLGPELRKLLHRLRAIPEKLLDVWR